MSEECPTCHGSGRIMSRETLITRIDYWLRRYKAKHRTLKLKLELHPEIAEFLKNNKKALRGLMWQNFVHLKILENNDLRRDEFRFLRTKDGADVTQEMNLDKENVAS